MVPAAFNLPSPCVFGGGFVFSKQVIATPLCSEQITCVLCSCACSTYYRFASIFLEPAKILFWIAERANGVGVSILQQEGFASDQRGQSLEQLFKECRWKREIYRQWEAVGHIPGERRPRGQNEHTLKSRRGFGYSVCTARVRPSNSAVGDDAARGLH